MNVFLNGVVFLKLTRASFAINVDVFENGRGRGFERSRLLKLMKASFAINGDVFEICRERVFERSRFLKLTRASFASNVILT